MTESKADLLALKKLRDIELSKLSELENEYDKVFTPESILFNEENPEETLHKEKMFQMMAELSVLETLSPKYFSSNEHLLFAFAKNTLTTEIKNLKILKNYLKNENDSLLSLKGKLNLLVHEEQNLLNSVKHKCIIQGININNLNESTLNPSQQSETCVTNNNEPMNELRKSINNLKELTKIRNSQILSFMNSYFPEPSEEQLNIETHADIFGEINSQPMQSLEKIINSLLVSYLNNSQNPWVTIDSTFWIPHIEFLLYCGIAVRNEENPNLIKLENFEL